VIERLLIAAHACISISQAQVSGCQRRLLAERQLKFPDRFFRAASGELQLAHSHPRQCVPAIPADRFSVSPLGLLAAAGGLQRLAQRDPCKPHLRCGGHGCFSHLYRCIVLAASQGHQADAHQRIGLARVLLQHELIAQRRLGQPAGQLFFAALLS
jgi:hypothetical protein